MNLDLGPKLPHPSSDLQELKADRVELGLSPLRPTEMKPAKGVQKHIGQAVQEKTELVGFKPRTGCPVGEQMGLMLFDEQLHPTAAAVGRPVQKAGRGPLQVRDHKPNRRPQGVMLGLGYILIASWWGIQKWLFLRHLRVGRESLMFSPVQFPSRDSTDVSLRRNSEFPASGTGAPTPAIYKAHGRKSVELQFLCRNHLRKKVDFCPKTRSFAILSLAGAKGMGVSGMEEILQPRYKLRRGPALAGASGV